jgi:hypothetical protein
MVEVEVTWYNSDLVDTAAFLQAKYLQLLAQKVTTQLATHFQLLLNF